MTKVIDDRYLGDGVYASLEGSDIVLDLRGQDNTTRIVLEPFVFAELVRFERNVSEAFAPETKEGG